ncbi:MAG TPA: DUF3052 domain-containing protein [Terriglobia bacterium]|nr:DUF3052 domain-containing protein [Terriglobia bacterium]
MPAGYSKKSLPEKLGIKEGARIAVLEPPQNYSSTLGSLPKGVLVLKKLQPQTDFIQFFASKRVDLENIFSKLKTALATDGMLWISWPKKASRMATDLDENLVREIGLQHGLVDIKVCAVDDIWSGLKFVYRIKDRK